MKTTSLKMRGIIATAAVGAALVATLGGCGAAPEATQATSTGAPAETASTRAAGVLLLSVNPEIEIEYDEKGLVTEVEGVNDEGRGIAESVRFATAASSLSVTRIGALDSIPFRAEVNAIA